MAAVCWNDREQGAENSRPDVGITGLTLFTLDRICGHRCGRDVDGRMVASSRADVGQHRLLDWHPDYCCFDIAEPLFHPIIRILKDQPS